MERAVLVRGDELIAASPGGSRRAESLEQQYQDRPDSQPRYALEMKGPHHTSDRRKAFTPTVAPGEQGMRKVMRGQNIFETSITYSSAAQHGKEAR
jgi:hypothetical protein